MTRLRAIHAAKSLKKQNNENRLLKYIAIDVQKQISNEHYRNDGSSFLSIKSSAVLVR